MNWTTTQSADGSWAVHRGDGSLVAGGFDEPLARKIVGLINSDKQEVAS